MLAMMHVDDFLTVREQGDCPVGRSAHALDAQQRRRVIHAMRLLSNLQRAALNLQASHRSNEAKFHGSISHLGLA